MNEIDRKFDGVSWEWKGRRDIRELKPICPKCQYELNIKEIGIEMDTSKGLLGTIIIHRGCLYSCPDCSFSQNSNIDVGSPKDLFKAARKEFERRQRLSENKDKEDKKPKADQKQ